MFDENSEVSSEEYQASHLEALLTWLHPDREQAGLVYEQLRRRLMKLFQCHGCAAYEDGTDEVLQRVGRKIAEGTELDVSDPFVYCHGFARNVLREYWRFQERLPTNTLDDVALRKSVGYHPQQAETLAEERHLKEKRLECLTTCLDRLDQEARELFLEYHRDIPGTKISSRDQIAKRLGVSMNILRIRICRIKDRLETCITKCVNRLGTR